MSPAGLSGLLAHGLGGRLDLPLPKWMFGYGAAAAVIVSFVALGAFWRTARFEDGPRERVLARTDAPAVRVLAGLARLAGLLAFAVVLVAAAIGDDSASTNLAPVAVYVVFWVGLFFVSALVGDLWQVMSPFDSLAAAVERLRGGRRGAWEPPDEDDGDGPPGRDWGYWPAAAGLLAFVWVELVFPDRARPRTLFVLMAAYTVVMLAAAVRYGRWWLREGEAFAALFGVVAHMAPVHAGGHGRLRLRPPFAGLAGLEWRPGLEALVLIALGSTTYDGLTRTQLWLDLTGDLDNNAYTAAGTAGLLWAIVTVAAAYVVAMKLAARLIQDHTPADDLRAAFVHSLVPIVAAYAVAHYFSLLVLEGQATIALVSDPLGRGWDLFGTAARTIDFGVVSTTTIAYVQCAAIVAGHVAGVVMAHDRALALFDKQDATRSQYPLLGAMVLFTVGGLFLLLGG